MAIFIHETADWVTIRTEGWRDSTNLTIDREGVVLSNTILFARERLVPPGRAADQRFTMYVELPDELTGMLDEKFEILGYRSTTRRWVIPAELLNDHAEIVKVTLFGPPRETLVLFDRSRKEPDLLSGSRILRDVLGALLGVICLMALQFLIYRWVSGYITLGEAADRFVEIYSPKRTEFEPDYSSKPNFAEKMVRSILFFLAAGLVFFPTLLAGSVIRGYVEMWTEVARAYRKTGADP